MISSSIFRRNLALAACVAAIGTVAGCGDSGSTGSAPMPAANLPAGAPTAPVDSKEMLKATKGSSSAAYDSTMNPALIKGNAPAK